MSRIMLAKTHRKSRADARVSLSETQSVVLLVFVKLVNAARVEWLITVMVHKGNSIRRQLCHASEYPFSARERRGNGDIFRVLKISIMQWCIIFRVVSSYSHDFLLPLVGCCIRRCMEETCCLDGRCVNFCSGFSTISNCLLVLALLLSNPCKDLSRSELNRLLVFLTNASWAGFPDNLPHELRKPPVSFSTQTIPLSQKHDCPRKMKTQ